ncbi:MAG: AbrB/MazE/SpoVT family DNA-binding domain-containing protein [Candidatus Beckwithbacteria bacterium]|nr:AbrB/MazE/SpoVT family DNA-binding domain-containing protein [Patescibacteria group bacterium]
MQNITISYPNQKGQIVIPKAFRKSLNIDNNVALNLNLTTTGIFISPVTQVLTKAFTENSYSEILKKTQGAWNNDSWSKTRIKRQKIELKAAKSRKAPW